jgi:hypothetical protein
MNEVKVFDGSGNLKEVISVKALAIRMEKQFEAPYLFLKNKKMPRRPSAKSSDNQEKAEDS